MEDTIELLKEKIQQLEFELAVCSDTLADEYGDGQKSTCCKVGVIFRRNPGEDYHTICAACATRQ